MGAVVLRRVDGQPTWLLSRANARAQDLLREALASAGVRGYHYRMLAALEEHGPASQAEIGRHTGIDRSDVVATLDELVERGLARRDPDRADRRRNLVTITSKGRALVEELDLVLARVQDDVLAPLDPPERDVFVALLARLA